MAGRLADFMVSRERADDFSALLDDSHAAAAAAAAATPATVVRCDFVVPPKVAAAVPVALARITADIASTRFTMLVFSGFGTVEMRRFCTFAVRLNGSPMPGLLTAGGRRGTAARARDSDAVPRRVHAGGAAAGVLPPARPVRGDLRDRSDTPVRRAPVRPCARARPRLANP